MIMNHSIDSEDDFLIDRNKNKEVREEFYQSSDSESSESVDPSKPDIIKEGVPVQLKAQ